MTETEEEQTPLEEVVDLLRKQKRRWRKWFAAVALVLMGVVLNQLRVETVANDAKDAADQAQEAIDLVLAQRTEARLYTCLKDKKFAEAHNRYVVSDAKRDNDFLDVLATAGGQRAPRPQDIPIIETQKAENNLGRDENLVAVPDCTAEGIAKFYEEGELRDPPVPATAAEAGDPSTSSSTTTSRARRPSSTTSTVGTTSSAPFHSSPRPSDPACTLLPGLTIPQELPCL